MDCIAVLPAAATSMTRNRTASRVLGMVATVDGSLGMAGLAVPQGFAGGNGADYLGACDYSIVTRTDLAICAHPPIAETD